MFDIGWSELLLIGIVALIAIGPKELPGALRTLGLWMAQDPAHGRRVPGPVPGGDARSRDRPAQERHGRHGRQGQGLHAVRSDRGRAPRHREIGRRSAVARPVEPANPTAANPSAEAPRRADRRAAAAVGRRRPALPPTAEQTAATDAAPRPSRRSPTPSPMRGGRPHEHRARRVGDRGQQGAADGAPDRAALAADQGAARVRGDVHPLLHLRQADLQRAGVAVRLGRRRRRTRSSSTPRCSNISSPS